MYFSPGGISRLHVLQRTPDRPCDDPLEYVCEGFECDDDDDDDDE